MKTFRYYDAVLVGMVAVWLCANLIGPAKITQFWIFPPFGAGILFFPFAYVLGDILTEVYGYARARRAIWMGFGAMVFASVFCWVILKLPLSGKDPSQLEYQAALEKVFSLTPRLLVASLTAFLIGELLNSFVLAKLKVATQGRFLWLRTIGSTIVAQAVDSLVFYPLAFLGIWEPRTVLQIMCMNYLMKVGIEICNTPVVYLVVRILKKAEAEDFYDVNTKFQILPVPLKRD
jgi:queuosine precursor transporter